MKQESANTIGKRFSILIKELKMNNNSFAKSLGKSSTTINYIVDDRTKPGFEVLESVLRHYEHVSPSWLLTGEGDIFRNNQPIESDGYLKDHLHTLEENFNRLASQLETKDTQIDRLTRMLESVLGKPSDVAAAGSGLRLHPATLQLLEPVAATA